LVALMGKILKQGHVRFRGNISMPMASSDHLSGFNLHFND